MAKGPGIIHKISGKVGDLVYTVRTTTCWKSILPQRCGRRQPVPTAAQQRYSSVLMAHRATGRPGAKVPAARPAHPAAKAARTRTSSAKN